MDDRSRLDGPCFPSVSIIVPVYNDATRLESCLRALEGHTYPRGLYEVIAVDNGSDEPVEPLAAAFPRVTLAIEPEPGAYAARNRGIALAKGEVIAFTDSDCVPAPRWVERGVAALLRTPNCGLVGGRIEIVFEDPEHPTAPELWTTVSCFNQQNYVGVDRFAATGNLFTFRRVLDQVGAFDSTLKSGGDVVCGRLVSSAGYTLAYADDACVAHPAIRSLRHVARRMARFAGRRRDFERRLGNPNLGLSAYLPRGMKQYAGFLAGVWRDHRLRRRSDKIKVLGVSLFVQAVVFGETIRLRLGGTPQR